MSDVEENKVAEPAREHLQQVLDLPEKHKLVEDLVHRQDMPRHHLVENLVHKQHLAALRGKLDQMHPADVAYILEALPLDQRLIVWDLVKAERDGEILLEVSDAVRETLIAHMDRAELVAAAESLDTEEIADLAPDLPQDVMQDVLQSLDAQNRARLQSVLAFEEGTVGALMAFDMVMIRSDITLEVVLRYLRRIGELPENIDKLLVVDKYNTLQGALSLNRLLVGDPDSIVADVMEHDVMVFHPEDDAADAAQAFERYDFVSAPVVDAGNRVVGRLTIEAVLDYVREESDSDMLSLAGLREEEDLFASVWKAARNRWTWLGINLITAFIASRVIGVFEGSIEKLVALAALMPIVAGIGGNSGNQTTTLIVRALALRQINVNNLRRLVAKEVGVSFLNGMVWGTVIGVIAYWLYGSASLGAVMWAAMVLTLLLAALVGIFIPITMHKFGRDPAVGSSVLLTAMTDSGGFFIFLGMATLFLI
jgi:magnesium transporter